MDRKSTQPKTQRRRKTAKAPSRKRRGVVVMAPRRPITRSAPVARTTSRSNGLSFYTAKFRGQVGVGVRARFPLAVLCTPLASGGVAYIGVSGSTGTYTNRMWLAPWGISTNTMPLGDLLQGISSSFTQYRVTSAKLIYEPFSATTRAGQFVIATSENPNERTLSQVSVQFTRGTLLSNFQGSRAFTLWQGATIPMRVDTSLKNVYAFGGQSDDYAVRQLQSAGLIAIGYNGDTVSGAPSPAGVLHLEAQFEYYDLVTAYTSLIATSFPQPPVAVDLQQLGAASVNPTTGLAVDLRSYRGAAYVSGLPVDQKAHAGTLLISPPTTKGWTGDSIPVHLVHPTRATAVSGADGCQIFTTTAAPAVSAKAADEVVTQPPPTQPPSRPPSSASRTPPTPTPASQSAAPNFGSWVYVPKAEPPSETE
jgi:hypothetical protein